MIFVIDASVACAWCLATQSTKAADALKNLANADFIAPFVFAYETRNALLRAERQQRLDRDVADRGLVIIEALVLIEEPANEIVLAEVVALSRRHQLSFYDACYLETAKRLDVRLATRDGGLLVACAKENVTAYDAT